MLDAEQPIFTYASVAMTEIETADLIAHIREEYRVNAVELKGSKLAKSQKGRRVILETLRAMRGNYLVTAYDKKLNLACKFFEYVFEPVLARNNALFYENDFHKFIAILIYTSFLSKEETVVNIISQFEQFMRSLDPNDAPVIFYGRTREVSILESLKDIISFIDGYRETILNESKHANDWVLDLTFSALWSHLAHWAERFDILHVFCDDSKPLRNFASSLEIMVNRPEAVWVEIGKKSRRLTFNLAQPVEFGSSSDQPGLQLADVASSAFLQAIRNPEKEWAKLLLDEIEPHIHEDCILPDLSYMDLQTPNCAVNALILHELGRRATEGRDPLYRMEDWYAFAHSDIDHFLESNNHPLR